MCNHGFGGLGNNLLGFGSRTCPLPITPPIGATINYSQGGILGPFPDGSTATLNCNGGFPTGNFLLLK